MKNDTKKTIKFYNRHIKKYIKKNIGTSKDKTILFICRGNSGRSQMAEAFFNFFSKNTRATSAGINPDEKIHPWTIRVMKEVGIDISRQKPKLISDKLLKKTTKIIFMEFGLSKKIPREYSLKSEEWQIEKLLGKSMEQIRKIRNQIKKRVKQLVRKLE
jgi:arsenate reductase